MAEPVVATHSFPLKDEAATLRSQNALQTLLQNPIKFVPASDRTAEDETSRIFTNFHSHTEKTSGTEQTLSNGVQGQAVCPWSLLPLRRFLTLGLSSTARQC